MAILVAVDGSWPKLYKTEIDPEEREKRR